ncbi:MAG TPA: signal peptidase I [Marmoricola sp.]
MHPDAPFQEKAIDQESGRRHTPLWMETVGLLVVALLLAIGIKAFFVQAFYIPSESMEPQFIKNDRIVVEKVSYWGSGTPQRGDIVVFKDPGNWLTAAEGDTATNPITKALSAIGLYPTGGHLVKRVIGVGGDRVICCDAKGRITVNGKALDETSYLPAGTKPSLTKFDVRVPAGDLWLMGDNRGNSYDSRGHMGDPGGGMVPASLVVGKVVALVWPLGRAEFIHRPADFKGIPDSR